MTRKVEIFSTLTCGNCGHAEKFQMPLYAKRTFFECSQCRTQYRTKAGECCIYCSYGDILCPPKQAPPPPPEAPVQPWWSKLT